MPCAAANRATLLSSSSALLGRQTISGTEGNLCATPRAPARLAYRVPMPTPKPEDDRLVWIDLEMTGLDIERHVIVEIACLVTDSELELVDDGIDIVVHQDADALAGMDDFVRKMHTKSGLLPQIEASTVGLATAGANVLDYIKMHVPGE